MTKHRWNGYADLAINFCTGCSNQLGCREACWARRMAHRLSKMPAPGAAPYRAQLEARGDAFWPAFHADVMAEWDFRLSRMVRPRRIALNFMADIGSAGVWDVRGCAGGEGTAQAEHVQAEVRAFCARHPRHTFLILTKRPAALLPYWPRNCWVGASASWGEELRRRWDALREVDAAVRWLSLEPWEGYEFFPEWPVEGPVGWVAIGGWSGARQMEPEQVASAHSLVGAARRLGIPVFTKDNLRSYGAVEWDLDWPQEFPRGADDDGEG